MCIRDRWKHITRSSNRHSAPRVCAAHWTALQAGFCTILHPFSSAPLRRHRCAASNRELRPAPACCVQNCVTRPTRPYTYRTHFRTTDAHLAILSHTVFHDTTENICLAFQFYIFRLFKHMTHYNLYKAFNDHKHKNWVLFNTHTPTRIYRQRQELTQSYSCLLYTSRCV